LVRAVLEQQVKVQAHVLPVVVEAVHMQKSQILT
jgi:hypothetical protein